MLRSKDKRKLSFQFYNQTLWVVFFFPTQRLKTDMDEILQIYSLNEICEKPLENKLPVLFLFFFNVKN